MLADTAVRYEVRARSFGEILDLGFRIVRDHFAVLLSIAAALYVPLALVGNALSGSVKDGEASAGAMVWLLLMVLVGLVVSPIVSVACTYAVGEVFLGRPVTFGAAMRHAMNLLMPLLGTALLATLLTGLGFLLLIVPGVYLMLSLLVVWQVGVIERQFGMRAIRRSRELMRGNLLRAFGILVVSGMIVGILGGVLQLVLGNVPFVGPLVSSLAQALGSAYATAVSVVLYFDIRCRKEGFEIEHLAQSVRAAAGVPGELPGTPLP